MRVGVIAYELEGTRSGVGRYLEGLLQGAAELGDDRYRWHLFMKGDRFDDPLFNRPGLDVSFDGRPGARPIAWEQIRLPGLLRRIGVDAVFSPGYSLPGFVGVPQIVTLHDLSFEHLREEFRWREGLRRRLLARQAARRATRVLVDTEAMAKDLQRTYRLEPTKIGVVPLAVDRRFFDRAKPDTDKLHELGVKTPYTVFLGSILPRRHVDRLIDAFARVAPTDMQLVIAGRDRLPATGQLASWIEASPARDRILRLDYVPEHALVQLYAGAEASVYLSSYEGYGLPPLESLAAGTVTLASPGMALDDLVPDYPFRTSPEADQVADAFDRLLNAADRSQVVDEARKKLAELSWQACAKRWLDELDIGFGRSGIQIPGSGSHISEGQG